MGVYPAACSGTWKQELGVVVNHRNRLHGAPQIVRRKG
jgi:hypothetical protein